MPVSRQPARKKKTNAEKKKARIKLKTETEKRRNDKERRQVIGLRTERQDLQRSLAEMITEVADIQRFISEEETKNKLSKASQEICHAAITDFTSVLESSKTEMKDTIKSLEELEDNALSRKETLEDVILPYNFTATAFIDRVFELTQKGADTLIVCNNELSSYSEPTNDGQTGDTPHD